MKIKLIESLLLAATALFLSVPSMSQIVEAVPSEEMPAAPVVAQPACCPCPAAGVVVTPGVDVVGGVPVGGVVGGVVRGGVIRDGRDGRRFDDGRHGGDRGDRGDRGGHMGHGGRR